MKKIFALAMIVMMLITMAACNRQIIDTTFNYRYGIICLADGTIVRGKVDSWRDFEDGDQIQVTINGNTYLVHSMNASLMVNEP